jgi:LCP family protein required for cell wall assembly
MSDYTYTPKPVRFSHWRRWAVMMVLVIAGALGAHMVTNVGNATITIVNRLTGSHSGGDNQAPRLPRIVDDPEYAMPDKDNSRLDILVLGMRGKGDPSNGGLLTDTILLFSLDTSTGTAALTSIPRDLTVRILDAKTAKINEAYIDNGLAATRKLYSRILGVNIDNVIVFDFEAFKYIVQTLGGVTITLDKPFEEDAQWGYAFSLPAGENTLDGDQALYYVRSRYGSSDFDRSRRQMQVIMAIKQKVTGLNLAKDPLKALELATTVRKHIETDMNIFDLGTLKDLAAEGDQLSRIRRYQLTTENLLYETMVNGAYELLPRDHTLAHIKEFFRTILTDHPVFPAPADPSPHTTTMTATPKPTTIP